ncbi:ubiquitin thioesterase otulin-like isoform X2 [Salvelinus namaycush]|uniref:Ubiquitin thioesterase otulin-like isoform X2 n=1 Tax=Salvelinus namaycush TaxID=8040 RepID=A0A8U0UIE2_SALNM|nr:ubiquitin thioesterase otulin-like isoform X2 [Salvelinus namaycush]
MGNWCCPAASPCDNVEEISGLLHGGVKVPESSSECGEVSGFHNGSKEDSEVRKTGGDDAEEKKDKEVAVVTVQVWCSVPPKTNGKEDIAQPQTIEKNGPLQTEDRQAEEPSPNTGTGLIANSILTALDKSIEDTATESTNVEAQICTSDPPQGPHKEDGQGGGDAEKVPAEIDVAVLAEQTSTVVQNEHSDNITITPDAKDKCPEAFALKAEIPVESITSETVDEDSTIPLHNAEPEKCCLGTVVVTSLPDSQLTPPEACEKAASTDSVPHLPSSPSPTITVMKGVDGKENRSSVVHLNDSPQDPEASPALTGATEPTQNGLVPQNLTGLVKEPVRVSPSGTSKSEEDLYRGAEELPQGPVKHAGPEPLFEITLPKVEDRCSLEPMVDITSYSEREWKGNTAKSTLIRKGYTELSQRFGSLRRVRGDNYCALRATLFQVLSTSTQLPVWLHDEHISTWLEELEGLIGQWMFPSECRPSEESEDAAQQLKRYMELLQNRWQEAVGCSSAEERLCLCERVFQGGEEELGLLEALKLLMLGRAVELHTTMQEGGDVPVFCWLLYARDSSDCPRSFLSNHLSQVGFSGGLEQVEMFLLGYALQCTIQVYRLYMAHTEEFVTYFPDDHKEDWPCVCLVTEDDRHYNVPVGQPNGLQVPEDLNVS